MFMHLKKTAVAALILSSIFTVVPPASALPAKEGPVVYINGRQQGESMTVSNRVLVQLSALQDSDWRVSYDAKTKTVVITQASKRKTIKLKAGQKLAETNGKKINLDVSVINKDGRTFVPLRFVSEELGGYVSYNAGEKRVVIRTPSGQKDYETLMSGDLTEAREVVTGLELVFNRGSKPLPVTGEGFTTEYTFPKGEALRSFREHKGMKWYGEVNEEGLLIVKWQKDLLGDQEEAGTPPEAFGESYYFADNWMAGLVMYGVIAENGEVKELGRISDTDYSNGEYPSIAPIEGEIRKDAKPKP